MAQARLTYRRDGARPARTQRELLAAIVCAALVTCFLRDPTGAVFYLPSTAHKECHLPAGQQARSRGTVGAYKLGFVNSMSFSAAQSNWLAFNNGLSIVNLSGTNLL